MNNYTLYISIILFILGFIYTFIKFKDDIGIFFMYFIILILSLITYIAFITIKNYKITDKILYDYSVSESNIKIVLYFFLFITYITLVIIPIKKISNKTILLKVSPPGDKGVRGNRGKTGDYGTCEKCQGGDLCYKKILYNITLTYNWWRKLRKLKPYSNDYIIKNEYLKSKIKNHCKSNEFSKIIEKYGAHTNTNSDSDNTCPNKLSTCGAYDYMFKMWTIWILIILSYDKGAFFLESELLTENDFVNLITPNDTKKTWAEMFDGDPDKISIKNNFKINKYELTSTGLEKSFFDKLYTTRASDTGSPFDEIKNYHAWYWGSDKNSKPKVNIIRNSNNADENLIKLKNACIQDNETKIQIKFKKTNNYYKVFSTDNSGSEKDGNIFKPFKQYGSNKVTFMRPYEYIDNDEHPKFRHYKPIGDVVFNSNELKEFMFESNKCMPDDIKYSDKNIKRLIESSKSTILVSGDVKHPTGYDLIFTTINRNGINKNITAFSVWKPIIDDNYTPLGYIVDTTPYIDIDDIPEPSTDIMVCVPKGAIKSKPTKPVNDKSTSSIYNKQYQTMLVKLGYDYDEDTTFNNDMRNWYKTSNDPNRIWTNNNKKIDGDTSNVLNNKANITIYKHPTLHTFSNIINMLDFNKKADIICRDLNSDIIDNSKNIKNECTQHNDSKDNCESNIKCEYDNDNNNNTCNYKKREYDDILKYSIMKIYK